MRFRTFGRLNWTVSEVGYGMWGLAGWTGSDDDMTRSSLQLAVDLGCNFFDTALAYGEGRSENLLGELVRANPDRKLYVASKVPPKNRRWPSRRGDTLADVFPPDHIKASALQSMENLGLPRIELLQFHVWEDDWANDDRWRRAIDDLKREKVIDAVGISINRWEPWNALRTIQAGGIDSVQVIYNIFDQAPEDDLFPVCQQHNVAVIARVPFDEGTLTGTLTKDSRWPEGDWRNIYFVPENLNPSVDRAEALKPLVPANSSLPEVALRYILSYPVVSTVIPGMRKPQHVRANIAASDAGPLPSDLIEKLRPHRWNRRPAKWSQ